MAISEQCPQEADCGWVEGLKPKATSFRWAADLTGYTVTLQLLKPDQTLITKVAVIDSTSATESTFHVNWDAVDVQAGQSRARLIFTDGTGCSEVAPDFIITAEEAWS